MNNKKKETQRKKLLYQKKCKKITKILGIEFLYKSTKNYYTKKYKHEDIT